MQLAKLIELIHRHAHRKWTALGTNAGVTYSEFEYLSAIKDQEASKTDLDDHGQHLQDVVENMGVRKASASAMVVKLEQRGWVRRVPCQYDARAQHILLTEAGEDQLATGKTIYDATARTLLEELGEAEIDAITRVSKVPSPP